MAFQEQTKKALARFGHGQRTAAWPPFSKHGPPVPPQGSPTKRDIPKEHPFDPRSLKPMAKTLWACSVSLGHALTAYRHFTRLKSVTVSPDGRLGGRGYVMAMQEIRQKLYDVCESLSAVSDTLHDEINAPHWKPKLAMLDEGDQEDVSRFVEESQEYLENPEEEAEEEMDDIEEKKDKKPKLKGKEDVEEDEEETASQLPTSAGVEEAISKQPAGVVKEASDRWASSLTVNTLPGPRVDGWDRADLDGPFGSVNPPEDLTSDTWGLKEPREYDYPGEGENYPAHQAAGHREWNPWQDDPRLKGGPSIDDYKTIADLLDKGMSPDRILNSPAGRKRKLEKSDIEDAQKMRQRGLVATSDAWAESVLPPTEETPTEAWDFGLGYGARGQGAGGYENPSNEGFGKGVWGPQSGLPGTPMQAPGDATPVVDVNINEHHGAGLLPGDGVEPVARRDEYDGPKGNLVNQMAQSWEESLPGEVAAPAAQDLPIDIDTGYVQEDTSTSWLPLGSPGTVLPPGNPGTRVE